MTDLYSESDIKTTLESMAAAIVKDRTMPLAFIGIETKGHIIAQRLKKLCEPNFDYTIQTGILDISLYNSTTTDTGFVSLGRSSITFPLQDKIIILVSEEIDTGKTITAALNALSDYDDPQVIECCCLVNKNNLTRPIYINHVGFNIDSTSQAFNKKTTSLFYEIDGEDAIKFDN